MPITLDGTLGITTPAINITGPTTSTGGLYSSGAFTGTFTDGVVVDYVTGLGRISVGSSDGIAFYNGGVANTETMRISSAGNVGIGTNNPIYKLDVLGVVNVRSAASATLQLYSTAATDQQNFIASYSNSGNIFSQLTYTASLHTWTIGSAEKMRIGANGAVNIGGTTTGGFNERLMVQSASATQASIMILNPGYGSGQLGFAATSSNFKFRNSYADGTLTNGVGFDIDPSGNLLVGYPESNPYASTRSLTVTASNGASISLQPTAAAGFSSRIWFPNSTNVYFDNSGTASYVFSTGNGAAYGVVTAQINNVSDYRLKENIKPLTGALDRLDRLKPVQYSFKDTVVPAMPWGTAEVDGFLAHEFGDVIIGGCSGEKDAVDENGEIKPQGVDMTRAIPLLVAAIQELKAEVKYLKQQLGK